MPICSIKMLKTIFTSQGGCSCSRTKSEEIFEPKPKAKESFDHRQRHNLCNSSSNSWERSGRNSIGDDYTSTTFSLNNINMDTTSTYCSEHDQNNNPSCSSSKRVTVTSSFPKFVDSVAVVKDSEDPYHDFRQSMLQMILEKEIYSKDDLQELLNCFLQLNSSSHHKIIVQAFMDIWNGVVSRKPKDHEHHHHHQIVS